jgi:enoyl-CoA hydratase
MSVTIEKNGPVTTVILSRPQARNAVDRATAEALTQAFRAFEDDHEALVGVFYGDNGTFCAGADLKAIARGAGRNRLEPDGEGPMGPSRLFLGKPVIAAVEGYAVAGGMELALWCDLRVMAEDAVFGVFCRRWGVPLIDGGTIRLPRLIGMSRALDLILTGRAVDAEEALLIGLANRVVPSGQTRMAAEALARQIAQFPQVCMRADRRSVYEQWELSFEDALGREFVGARHALAEGAVAGAGRFAAGAGRHGRFGV